MVGGEEDKGQIDGGRADLHLDGVREVAGGGFRIGLARECSRELKRGRSCCACGMDRHSMNVMVRTCRLSVFDRLDPRVHPFRAVLSQLVIVAPHV